MFRIFKISRYVTAVTKINEVFENKKEELVIALVFIIFMLMITSTVMYYVENEIQPENFSSIPSTMWWGIATLTTVGYGDVYPVSGLGKFMGGLIAILGVGIFALPAGILASGFSEVLSKPKKKDGEPCPCCGKVHEV
jgi:voltage-gated potassium channel